MVALQQQVSENVRVLSSARGTTPTEVARAAGLKPERIQAKLSGRVRWNVEDIELLARALGATPEDLVSPALLQLRRPRQDSNLQPTGYRPRTRPALHVVAAA